MPPTVIAIDRGFARTIVVTANRRHPLVPRRFWKGDVRDRYSRAVGYASRLAYELEAELVDRTGYLSAEECAELVAAQEENGARASEAPARRAG